MGQPLEAIFHAVQRYSISCGVPLKIFQSQQASQTETEPGDFLAVHKHSWQMRKGNLCVQHIQIFQVLQEHNVID